MTPPTRRGLLGTAAALLAAPVPSVAATHPDAALIAACAEFDALERAYIETFEGIETNDEWDAMEPEHDRISNAQGAMVKRICSLPAATMDGLRAKARSLVLCDDKAINEDASCTNDRLRTSLLRDLLGSEVA